MSSLFVRDRDTSGWKSCVWIVSVSFRWQVIDIVTLFSWLHATLLVFISVVSSHAGLEISSKSMIIIVNGSINDRFLSFPSQIHSLEDGICNFYRSAIRNRSVVYELFEFLHRHWRTCVTGCVLLTFEIRCSMNCWINFFKLAYFLVQSLSVSHLE